MSPRRPLSLNRSASASASAPNALARSASPATCAHRSKVSIAWSSATVVPVSSNCRISTFPRLINVAPDAGASRSMPSTAAAASSRSASWPRSAKRLSRATCRVFNNINRPPSVSSRVKAVALCSIDSSRYRVSRVRANTSISASARLARAACASRGREATTVALARRRRYVPVAALRSRGSP
jgi:hypothetical protein